MTIKAIKSVRYNGNHPMYQLEKGTTHIGILAFKEGEYQFKSSTWTKDEYGWLLTGRDCIEIGEIAERLTEAVALEEKETP